MPGATFGVSTGFTISTIDFLFSEVSVVEAAAEVAGMFSLSMTEKSIFLAGESFILRLDRLLAACTWVMSAIVGDQAEQIRTFLDGVI